MPTHPHPGHRYRGHFYGWRYGYGPWRFQRFDPWLALAYLQTTRPKCVWDSFRRVFVCEGTPYVFDPIAGVWKLPK